MENVKPNFIKDKSPVIIENKEKRKYYNKKDFNREKILVYVLGGVAIALCVPLAIIYYIHFYSGAGIAITKLSKALEDRSWWNIALQSLLIIITSLAFFILFQIIVIVVPLFLLRYVDNMKPSNIRSLKSLLRIRTHLKWTLFFIVLVPILTNFAYDTTLLDKLLDILSHRLQGKEAEKNIPIPLNQEQSTLHILFHYFERIHISFIIFMVIMSFTKYLVTLIKYSFHEKTFGKRIEETNSLLIIIADLYNRVVSPEIQILYSTSEELFNITSIHFKSKTQASVIGKSIYAGLLEDIINDDSTDDELDVNVLVDKQKLLDAEVRLLFENKEKLTRQDFIDAIVNFYTEREDIKKCLKSNSQIIKKLARLLFIITYILTSLLSTSFLDFGFMTAWSAFLALFSALSFALQAFGRTSFESMVFIFVIHSFDVGDLVIVEGSGDKLWVEEIEVFSCKFKKEDGTIVYIPNTSLFSKSISNISRTKRSNQM